MSTDFGEILRDCLDSMRSFFKFLAACVMFTGAGYVAYALIFPTYHVRYRLTVDVDINGAVHQGTGVVEISYQIMPDTLTRGFGGSHFGGTMRGYAITIELGPRDLVFLVDANPMLINKKNGKLLYPEGSYLGSLPLVAYGLRSYGEPSVMEGVVRELQSKSGSVEISFDKLPMILHLRNFDDVHSIEELDPKNLAADLGSGVNLSNAKLELTTDPVSPMPKNWPNWLRDTEFHSVETRTELFSMAAISSIMFKGN